MSPILRTGQSGSGSHLAAKAAVRALSVLAAVLLPGVSARMQAAVINATDTSLAAVQMAVNQASNGDTVMVPAGNAVWTNTLFFSKDIRLIGSGIGSTTIIDNVGGGNGTLIQITAVANNTLRVSGFTFTPSGASSDYSSACALVLLGKCSTVRVDNCEFLNLNCQAILFGNACFGVVDHCLFRNLNHGNPASGIVVYNGSTGGEVANSAFGGYGDVSYSTADPVLWGHTNEFVYIESCVFDFYGAGGNGMAFNDMKWGSRMVVRYNMITNGYFQTHATLGRERGGRAFEVYGNTFVHTGEYAGHGSPFYLTSGSGVIYSNTFINWGGFGGFINYRASTVGVWNSPSGLHSWGPANGQNGWDSNTNGLIHSGTHTGGDGTYYLEDTNASWTPGQFIGSYELQNLTLGGTNTSQYSLIITNTATRLYYQLSDFGVGSQMLFSNGQSYAIFETARTLDQIGAGNGDLIADTAYGNGMPINTVTHSQSWPHQPIDPLYIWDNTLNGSPLAAQANWNAMDLGTFTMGNYNDIKLGVDYLNAVRPNYTPLAFPHPLVDNSGATNGGGLNSPIPPSNLQARNPATLAASPLIIATNHTGGGSNDIVSGLVSWWPLAGDANDHSTNGNNGASLGGAIYAAGPNGVANTAISLNGASQFVNYGTGPVGDFTSTDFTVSFWVNAGSLANSPVPIFKGYTGVNGYSCVLNSDGSVAFLMNNSGIAPTITTNATAAGALAAGGWNLVTIVRSGPAVHIYLNGVDKTSLTQAVIDPAGSDNYFLLGCYNFAGSNFLGGSMAGVRLYRRALSAAEVEILYTNGTGAGIY